MLRVSLVSASVGVAFQAMDRSKACKLARWTVLFVLTEFRMLFEDDHAVVIRRRSLYHQFEQDG